MQSLVVITRSELFFLCKKNTESDADTPAGVSKDIGETEATNCWSNCVQMIYKTHIRNNLSSCCPGEFIANEFERIKSHNLMKLPALSVDGAVQPQAVVFAYRVDSSSDSTRRLTLSRTVVTMEMWAVVQEDFADMQRGKFMVWNSQFPSEASRCKNLFHLFIGQVSLMEFAQGNANVWRKRTARPVVCR